MLKEKVLILLKRQKKTQKDLCNSIGISDTGLRKIFARDSCKISLLKKISNFFGVPLSYFFEEDTTSGNAVASGDFSAASINGNASAGNIGEAVLRERIKSLEQLLDEKERLIKVLMEKKQ